MRILLYMPSFVMLYLYLALKATHLIGAICWFAGLFYLPRLFVYHAMLPNEDQVGDDRFKVMERKLYRGIMTPAMLITLAAGTGMLLVNSYTLSAPWLHFKLTVVVLLVGYHHMCGKFMRRFQAGENQKSHVWFRWFNEAPVFALLAIVILAVFKPVF